MILLHANHNTHGWISTIGYLHPVLLHFPIALIYMTGIAHLMHKFEAERFLLFATAIVTPVVALLGFAYGYRTNLSTLYWWHAIFGFLTAGIAILTTQLYNRKIYPYLLALLVILVTIAGYFGGVMTFGSPI